jgi:hypothetical protein
MFEVISKKCLRFVPTLLVLICGFAFTYYALLQNQHIYAIPILSLIKTSLSMFVLFISIGEISGLVEQGSLLESHIYYDNLPDYEVLCSQIRSVILWVISHICYCCCCSSFIYI